MSTDNQEDDVYFVIMDGVGGHAGTAGSCLKSSVSKLRYGGHKVRTFRNYEDYCDFLDKDYAEYWEESRRMRLAGL